MEDYRHELECPSCETVLEVQIVDVDEFPVYCPMCGEDVSENWNPITD